MPLAVWKTQNCGTLPVRAKDRIIVALDVDTQKEALSLAGRLAGHVGSFKVSLHLFSIAGPEVVRQIQAVSPVFVDLKLHDIPSAAAAVGRTLTDLGCAMLSAHAAGGAVMLRKLVEAVSDESQRIGKPAPMVLAETVLTSINQRQFEDDLLISNMLVSDATVRYACKAQEAGANGVICSANEVKAVRAACGDDFTIAATGIRPTWYGSNDQRRVNTPFDAIKAGADYIVIGRPITRAIYPVAAAHAIAEEMESACADLDT